MILDGKISMLEEQVKKEIIICNYLGAQHRDHKEILSTFQEELREAKSKLKEEKDAKK